MESGNEINAKASQSLKVMKIKEQIKEQRTGEIGI